MIVVGVGCGPGMLTLDAIEEVRRARRLYGSGRALELVREFVTEGCDIVSIKDYSRLRELPEDAVLLSTGDPMLAGLGHLGTTVVPGISSMQVAFSRLRLPLAQAVVVDAHGKDEGAASQEVLDELFRGRIPFVLTQPGFDVKALAGMMLERGLEVKIVVCERLGYEDERIVVGDAHDPPDITSTLCSLILLRGDRT